MRTTIDVPPDLFRKAKARAAARGESLKTLVTRAVATEIGRARDGGSARVALPLFGDRKGQPARVRPSDFAQALADQDADQARRARRRRR